MKKNFIVLDTETMGSLASPLPYNVGWAVTDRFGNILKKREYLIAETYKIKKDLMQSFYYKDKKPYYDDGLKNKRIFVARYDTIVSRFYEDVKKYNVHEIFAHNMRFDYRAMNNLADYLNKTPFYHDLTISDTMEFAKDVILTQPTYRKFCETNGFMTKHKPPRPQTKAETYYRYISKNTDFEEMHTALADVEIEVVILAKCFAQHKKHNRVLIIC